MAVGDSRPLPASINKAATAATCGAAAEVPKKFGRLSESTGMSLPKNVVFVPSTPVIWGLLGLKGVDNRLPFRSNNSEPPPSEENVLMVGNAAPNACVK